MSRHRPSNRHHIGTKAGMHPEDLPETTTGSIRWSKSDPEIQESSGSENLPKRFPWGLIFILLFLIGIAIFVWLQIHP